MKTSQPRASAADPDGAEATSLILPYRPPYDWDAMLAFLAARAVSGVEEVGGNRYRRTVESDGVLGTVEIAHDPERARFTVVCRIRGSAARETTLERARRLLDADADVETIAAHLGGDPLLAPLVAQRPGLRAPGAWDGFELAVRAILGQQVTLAAARRLAGRLVSLCGRTLDETLATPSLTHTFPSAERLLACDLGALGMPGSRRAALRALAEESVADPQLFTGARTLDAAVARLRSIRGIGEWTAQYIALRALRHADAFPSGDAALVRSVAALTGARPTPAELLERAAAWRPWRAYAAQYLWSAPGASAG